MSTTNYVTVTNDAIEESGADLATFDTGGADWTSNTNTLMNRMKRYVARAWRDIQQEAFDWGFLEEQAVVNINPGVMFYTDGSAITTFDGLENTNVDIFDQDGSTAISAVPFGTIKDLTGISTDTKPYGYFNVVTTGSSPITWSLKPGAEYFSDGLTLVATNLTQDIAYNPAFNYKILWTDGSPGPDFNIVPVNNISIVSDGHGTFTLTCTIEDSAANRRVTTALGAGFSLAETMDGIIFYSSFGTTVVTLSGTAYIHSWKSFNFSEETGVDDFQENIKEVDQKSFRTIDYFKSPATGEVPIEYVPWESFARLYDISSAPPGIPRIITRDNTNRFKLYPHPYYIFTLKFDYTRTPQDVSAYNDVFKGLDEDYIDIVMWKALIYYGEFDEQPSVVARATKNYKNFLTRLEQLYRQKFHFMPARLS